MSALPATTPNSAGLVLDRPFAVGDEVLRAACDPDDVHLQSGPAREYSSAAT